MSYNFLHVKFGGATRFVPVAVFFIMSFFLMNSNCSAGAPDEITHLLSFIEKSECTFIRNGKEYSSQKAKKHIQQKYEHLRNRIKTAEDFIFYSASRSSMSGKPYRIICNNRELMTADWLTAELDKLRAK